MFSYTDDAIVTSSPTGRHLSTVIRRPCVLMSGWDEHAEAICKVLNDLDSKAKAYHLRDTIGNAIERAKLASMVTLDDQMPLGAGPGALQSYARMERQTPVDGEIPAYCPFDLPSDGPKMRYAPDAEQRIAVLERRITDYQVAADKPIEMSGEILRQLYGVEFGSSINHNGRTFKRVE